METQWKEQTPCPGELGENQERGGSELTEGTRWRKCPRAEGTSEHVDKQLVSCSEALGGGSTGWGRTTSGKEDGEGGWPGEPQQPEVEGCVRKTAVALGCGEAMGGCSWKLGLRLGSKPWA